jgi:glutamine---fructose-6-phosphate transaminase (isomerizing)
MMNADFKKELWEVPDALRIVAHQPLPGAMIRRIKDGRFSYGMWLARGTSKFAAMWLAMVFFELSDFRVFHLPFSVAARRPGHDLSKILYFALSESGATPEVLDAVRQGKASGAACYCIVNERESELIRLADEGTFLDIGPGEGFTFKSFIAMALHAARLADSVGGESNLLEGMEKMGDLADRILDANPLQELSGIFLAARRAMFLGRGLGSPVAGNLALKLREIPMIPSDSKSTEEYLHGYGESASREDSVNVILVTDEAFLSSQLKTARHLQNRRSNFIIICPEALRQAIPGGMRTFTVPTPDSPVLSPLCMAVAFYRMLYSLTMSMGLDADDDNLVGKLVSPASFRVMFPELQ